MLGELVDPVRQQCDLDLGGAGVGLVQPMARDRGTACLPCDGFLHCRSPTRREGRTAGASGMHLAAAWTAHTRCCRNGRFEDTRRIPGRWVACAAVRTTGLAIEASAASPSASGPLAVLDGLDPSPGRAVHQLHRSLRCGKTTLLRAIAGLVEIEGGSVRIGGDSPTAARRHDSSASSFSRRACCRGGRCGPTPSSSPPSAPAAQRSRPRRGGRPAPGGRPGRFLDAYPHELKACSSVARASPRPRRTRAADGRAVRPRRDHPLGDAAPCCGCASNARSPSSSSPTRSPRP